MMDFEGKQNKRPNPRVDRKHALWSHAGMIFRIRSKYWKDPLFLIENNSTVDFMPKYSKLSKQNFLCCNFSSLTLYINTQEK